jgi:uncharacterized small protein (DUF1192 family)
MTDDDLVARGPNDPLPLLVRQDLGPLSQEDLTVRIAVLEAEIARTQGHIRAAAAHRSTAESLFRRD